MARKSAWQSQLSKLTNTLMKAGSAAGHGHRRGRKAKGVCVQDTVLRECVGVSVSGR